MAKILKKKSAYQEVNTNIMQNTLEYVSEKYGLTSDYTVTGFKLGKNGIEIKVVNKEVECTFLVTDRNVIDLLTAKNAEDDEE